MSHRRLVPFFLLILAALCAPASAQTNVVRVPRDVKDLQSAIRVVKNGGAIELAAGTYASPSTGYGISNLGKAFTIRAAQGATVILDGRGQGPILRFRNGTRARGRAAGWSPSSGSPSRTAFRRPRETAARSLCPRPRHASSTAGS